MDDALRNRLWNCLTQFYVPDNVSGDCLPSDRELDDFMRQLWHSYFKEPQDRISPQWHLVYQRVRKYYFECPWNEVYDLLEFAVRAHPAYYRRDKFVETCNAVLTTEMSAYRFVTYRIIEITSQEEIEAIEKATNLGSTLSPVSRHLQRSIELLADRASPNYRDSVKESVLAVEALSQILTGNNKATLGDAIKVLGQKVRLHGAFTSALSKLYGFSSDAEGIRHALLDEPTLDFNDAKFMLVACSAFVNYVVGKTAAACISL